MAMTAEVQERDLLRDYVRALHRSGGVPAQDIAPGLQLRRCAECGEEASFRLDPEGAWAACGNCGRLA